MKSAPRAQTCPVHQSSARTAYAKRGCRCEVCVTQRRSDARRWYATRGREQQRRWRARHRTRYLARKAKYRAARRDDLRAKERARYRENADRRKSIVAAYRRAHPDRCALHKRRYRARRRAADGFCSREQLEARIEFYGARCYLCREPFEAIDHVIPVSRGGSEWPANLRPVCKSCNSRKGTRPLREVLT